MIIIVSFLYRYLFFAFNDRHKRRLLSLLESGSLGLESSCRVEVFMRFTCVLILLSVLNASNKSLKQGGVIVTMPYTSSELMTHLFFTGTSVFN